MANLNYISYGAILISILVTIVSMYAITSEQRLKPCSQLSETKNTNKLALGKESALKRQGFMTWEEYISKAQNMANLLLAALRSGKFELDMIIGISDGGLIVAELIGKALDSQFSVPIVSLWSRRSKDKKDGVSHANFNNTYNYALAQYLRTLQHELQRPLSIALIDHRLVTGETALLAINFLENQVGKTNIQILFLPLMSKKPGRSSVIEKHLPHRYVNSSDEKVFDLTRQQYFQSLLTKAMHLPYQRSAIDNHLPN